MARRSKRHFLKALVAANSLSLLGSTATKAAVLTDGAKTSQWRWETLQAQQLESLIGQNFSVYGSGTSYVMSLGSVDRIEDPNRPTEFVRKNSFSAILIPTGAGCHKLDQLAHIAHPYIGGKGLVFAIARSNEQGEGRLEIVFS